MRSKLQGVLDQIDQDLLEAPLVSNELRQCQRLPLFHRRKLACRRFLSEGTPVIMLLVLVKLNLVREHYVFGASLGYEHLVDLLEDQIGIKSLVN